MPYAIEIYNGRPIIYSLGNFVFGHAQERWGDNFLAEIVLDQGRIKGILTYPISGVRNDLLHPELLVGERAGMVLHNLQVKSAWFGTGLAINGRVGYVKID